MSYHERYILFIIIIVTGTTLFWYLPSNLHFFTISEPIESNPCQPSPCGPNSQCKEVNNQAICSCAPNYMGTPPTCRPECIISSECPLHLACSNQRCMDPCSGSCGVGATCKVINHNPVCSCPSRYSGDPFIRCFKLRTYLC